MDLHSYSIQMFI